VQGQRGQSVWLVGKENKAESRVIDVGEWSQGNWVVRSGLREGDTVIVDGAIRLAPGAPVKPVAAAPRPASDGPSPVPPSAPPARPAAPGAPGAAEAGKGAAS